MIHIFLINPLIENEPYIARLREELEDYKSIRYFIFNMKDSSDEDVVVKRILKYLNDDTLRFYVVGGTTALHRVLNAVDGFFDRVELAWIPVGNNKSFLHSFYDNNDHFLTLKDQIYGQAYPIDYIRTNYGLAINSISSGVDTEMMKLMHRVTSFPSLSRTVHIKILKFYSVLFSKDFSCGFEVDKGNYLALSPKKQFFFGNGAYVNNTYSISNDATINDGVGEYFIDYDFSILSFIKKLFNDSRKGSVLSKNSTHGKCQKIRFISEAPININMDGILYEGLSDLDAKIISNQLMFVLPSNVKIS